MSAELRLGGATSPTEMERFFTDDWPEHVRKLRAALIRRGLPTHDLDDVIQETALRVYRHWANIDFTSALTPLLVTVALRAWFDLGRRYHPTEDIENIPEQPDPAARVESTVLARLELGRVGNALRTMPPTAAAVLRDVVTEHAGDHVERRPASVAVRKARSRARQVLTMALAS
jgi:DNA-directed RNA polymerase specialized sigma24 family protein